MSLWTPYKDEPRVPGHVQRQAPPPSSDPPPLSSATFRDPLNSAPTLSPHNEQPNYQYIGYEPVLLPHEESRARLALTPDSGCSSGCTSPPPKLKVGRPFRQMTSRAGTTVSSIRDYYALALRAPSSNPRMRRAVVGRMEGQETGVEYVERRMKNNAAAKRSRELRKLKEDQLAINLAFLEAENHRLNLELSLAKERLEMYASHGRAQSVSGFQSWNQ